MQLWDPENQNINWNWLYNQHFLVFSELLSQGPGFLDLCSTKILSLLQADCGSLPGEGYCSFFLFLLHVLLLALCLWASGFLPLLLFLPLSCGSLPIKQCVHLSYRASVCADHQGTCWLLLSAIMTVLFRIKTSQARETLYIFLIIKQFHRPDGELDYPNIKI